MADATQETLQSRNGHAETSHHPRADTRRPDKDYYGIPPIKEHTWTWEVPIYFWLGGIGSGAHVVNTIARLMGHNDKALIRAGRYTTLICMLLSPLLLISDLGRPERFYNMLRIAKWRSPMSMGTWGLSVFASLSGLVAAHQAAEDGLLGRESFLTRLLALLPDRLIGTLAAPFGIFVGAYTGVLIALTSTPIWARNAVLMGPLFLTSAMSTGLSAISFVLHLFGAGEEKTLEGLRRAEESSLSFELGLLGASLIQMGRWGKPLRTGKVGAVFFGGTVVGGLLAPFALLQGRESRGRSLLASILVLIGGYLLRHTILDAGKLSARDPEATFTFAQKENLPLRNQNV
ncbi:MAG: polysulfide reductase NrfD [Actinomycetota bacterium]|nr:polysulfide reductase NrfD [Actinomycetota bacterium]